MLPPSNFIAIYIIYACIQNSNIHLLAYIPLLALEIGPREPSPTHAFEGSVHTPNWSPKRYRG